MGWKYGGYYPPEHRPYLHKDNSVDTGSKDSKQSPKHKTDCNKLKLTGIAPMARIYDKTTDEFVKKDNFAIQMSPMRTRNPDEPLHTEEFSLTKNRPDLKLKLET